MGRPTLLVSSPLLGSGGYAEDGRTLTMALAQTGVDLSMERLVPDSPVVDLMPTTAAWLSSVSAADGGTYDTHLVNGSMGVYAVRPKGRRNIRRLVFETTSLPATWVKPLRAYDEVWTASEFNRATFAAAGVPAASLRVVPSVIDFAWIDSRAVDNHDRGIDTASFIFLSVFRWQRRKGWDILIKAFMKAFRRTDRVTLLMKVDNFSDERATDLSTMWRLASECGYRDGDARMIRVATGGWSQHSMAGLYRAANAFVLPSRGEGWCRPCMEAMAIGLPTIATGWGGNTEYMTPTNSYLIDFELRPVTPLDVREQPLYAGQSWAEPAEDHVIELLRAVFEDRQDARLRGAKGRADVRERYTADAVARLLRNRVMNR